MSRIPYSPRVETWNAVGGEGFPSTSLGIVRVRYLAEKPRRWRLSTCPASQFCWLLSHQAPAFRRTSGIRPGEDWVVSVHEGDPFFPTWVDVGVGATVKWTNYGSGPEVVRSGTPTHPTPVFSAWIAPNASFRYTFTRTGTFEFFLKDHPDIQGRVTIR